MKFPKISRARIGATVSVVLGNLLYALVMKLFLLPADLVTGGTTGIALVMEHWWNVPLSGFVFLFNMVMLVAGWLILGRGFALTTLASSFLYPLFLELCQQIFGDLVLTQDLMLSTVFSGLGIGVALGTVIRGGASTGGMDIPPLVLNKLCGIPVSVSLYAFDFCILLAQVPFRPMENVLYGLLLMLIYTAVLDKMLLLGNSRTELKIVSDHSDEICHAVLERMDRGVTLLHGTGGYTGKATEVVFTVVSNRELVKVERLIREIDPACFLVISRVREVQGRGFSLNKQYR